MTKRRSHSYYTLSYILVSYRHLNLSAKGRKYHFFRVWHFISLFSFDIKQTESQIPMTNNIPFHRQYVHLWSWSQVPLNKIYLNFTKVYTIIHKNQFQNSFFKSFNSQDLIVNSPLPLLHIFQLLVIRIWC